MVLGLVILNLDDLLCGANAEGWGYFTEVVDCFNHSGAEWIRGQNLCYMGLDMGWGKGPDAVFLGQQAYFDTKLIPVADEKFVRKKSRA